MTGEGIPAPGEGIPPGMRRIDPDAEAARLADERKQATEAHRARAGMILLLDETQHIDAGGGLLVPVRVTVTAGAFRPVPANLGRKLLAVVRENWPAR